MGIIADTGNFSHSNTTKRTLNNASKLLEYEVNVHSVNFYTFKRQTKERAKLHSLVMSKINYYLDGKVAVIAITKNDLLLSGASSDETEGFINFIMGIDGVRVGVSLLEVGENNYKISLRGNDVDVSEIAGVYGGGGHKAASGCQMQGLLFDVIDKLTYTIKQRIND